MDNNIKETIRLFPLISDLEDDIINILAKEARFIKYSLGDNLSRLDKPSGDVYFIVKGSIRSIVY